MKTRFSRNEDARRALQHEERSSAPPMSEPFDRDDDVTYVMSDHGSEMNARLHNPDIGKEVSD